MDIRKLFTEDQILLLEEALNIGAGNAVTALSQLLQCDTDMSFPALEGFLIPLTSETLRNHVNNHTRVEMNIVGELQGGLVVIIPEDDELKLTNLIRGAKEEQRGEGVADILLITEIANIMAGVFLTAIHDFCGLNIFHTVPVAGKGITDSLDEMIQNSADDRREIILLITNEFSINKSNMKTYLMVILSTGNAAKLIEAIENIKMA
jgi:chemotaxis protein CheC